MLNLRFVFRSDLVKKNGGKSLPLNEEVSEAIVYFPLIFHAHQPVGQFDHVCEKVFQSSYNPLIKELYEHSKVKVCLHYSGFLLEWLEYNHPEHIDMVRSMVKRGQAEILSGGYYEPILAVIPEEDRVDQISLHKTRIKEIFNYDPKGLWLAERVWEPQLPKSLHKAGIEYVLIDDNHIKYLGFKEEETFYPFVTEDQGYPVKIFPINETIRYLTPWKLPEETKDFLSRVKNFEKNRIVVFSSDSEKMGEWPAGDRTTHDICYVSGYDGRPWMSAFLKMIEETPWIIPTTLSEYVAVFNPSSLIYLPTVSYDKLSVWSLPTGAQIGYKKMMEIAEHQEIYFKSLIFWFSKGGFWRNFLTKYSESSNMHNKMLYVRKKILEAEKRGADESLIGTLKRELFKAQCNDVYWHGLFGGVYLRSLRNSVYKHLIFAEREAEKLLQNLSVFKLPRMLELDFNCDFIPEILIEGHNLNVYISPHKGGSVFELDSKKALFNLLNVKTRVKEPYHENVPGLIFDRHSLQAFRIYLLPENSTKTSVMQREYQELGSLSWGDFRIEELKDTKCVLKREEYLKVGQNGTNITFLKSFQIAGTNRQNETLTATFTIENKGPETLKGQLIIETPLVLISELEQTKITNLENNSEIPLKEREESIEQKYKKLSISDPYNNLNIKITATPQSCLLIDKILTTNITDFGREDTYQGLLLVHTFPFNLNPNEKQESRISLTL